MATASNPTQPVKTPKHETFVEQQLQKAESRIRWLDIGSAVAALAMGTLLYGLMVMLLDRWLQLPPLARQVAFGLYAAAAGALVVGRIILPLSRRINPYYAAVKVEHASPGAKNSIVNWLDLKDEPLPWPIRAAVGQKAAKDLSKTPLEEAIDGRHTLWLVGGLIVLIFAVLLALIGFGPKQFGSLVQRTFFPFSAGGIQPGTVIDILEPQPADTVVPLQKSVDFRIRITGRVPEPNAPDAAKLLFRYSQSDPTWTERPFERTAEEWNYRLPSFELVSGFWYKIRAGDVETAEHRIDVRSRPLITGFEVKYQYRPYLRRPDYATQDPNLEGLRGTQVTLTVRTNRPVQRGTLVFHPAAKDGKKQEIQSEAVPESREALRCRLVLDQEGTYDIRYLAADGEPSEVSMPYTVKVIPDHPPEVRLTEPASDIELPINGVLQAAGTAFDDFGITGMTLRMRIKDGPGLEPRRYRQEEKKSFQLADGSYLRSLEYRDVIELSKLKDEAGKPVALQPNMQIEYWLEATDNCDFPPPGPNVGKSLPQLVTLAAAADPRKQQEALDQAQQKQQQHVADQDHQLSRANQARQNRPEEPPPQDVPADPTAEKIDKANNQKPACDATSDDVAQAANDLKSDKPQTRQQGENRLRDIEQQAKDDSVRKEAGQALEDAGLKERSPENATLDDVKKAANDLRVTRPPADAGKRQQAQKRLNDIKDQAKRPDVRDAAAEALKNQPNTPENATQQDVDRAANDLKNNNPETRQQSRRDLRDIKEQAKDQNVAKSADKNLQQGAQNANPDDVKQASQDMQNGQANGEQDLRDMAQQAKDPKVRQAAERALQQAGKNPNLDPRQASQQDVQKAGKQAQSGKAQDRQQGRNDLRDIAEQASDPNVRQAAEKALQDANQNASQVDVQNAAQQAQSDSAPQRQRARQDLDKMAQQAQKPDVKKAAQDAWKQANQKANQEDVKQAAQQAQSGNAQDRQEGRRELQQVQQHAQDQGTQQAARDALKQANQKANPDDVKQAGQQAQSGNAQERQAARHELQQMQQHAQDKGTQQAARDALKQANQKAKQEDVKQAGQQAQSGNAQERQQARDDLQSMLQQAQDAGTKQAAQDALKQANQQANQQDVDQAKQQAQSTNPTEKQQGQKNLRDIANQSKDAGAKQSAQEALKQSAEHGSQEDLNQAKEQAQSSDPAAKQQGQQQLRDLARHAKDPQVKQGAEKALEQSAEQATSQDARQAAQDAAKSGSSAEKQEAKDTLKEMQKHAQDPSVRKQAADALKELAKHATKEDVARLAKELLEQAKGGGADQKPDPQELKEIAELAKDPDVQKLARDVQKEIAKQSANRQAGKPQLDQAAKEQQSGDPKQSEAGTEKLQDIAQQAQDPDIRKQADEMLKQAGKPTQRPGQNATPQDVAQAESDLKSTDRQRHEQGLKKLLDAAKNSQDPVARDQAGNALGNAGVAEEIRDQVRRQAAAQGDTAQAMKANLEFKKFAGELQLENFKKSITPDMLKQANVSPDEWERFLQAQREYQQRLAKDLQEVEKLDPKERVILLPQGGVRRVDAAQGTPENLNNAGRSLPPPEYRNAYQDFTRELSKLKPKER